MHKCILYKKIARNIETEQLGQNKVALVIKFNIVDTYSLRRSIITSLSYHPRDLIGP